MYFFFPMWLMSFKGMFRKTLGKSRNYESWINRPKYSRKFISSHWFSPPCIVMRHPVWMYWALEFTTQNVFTSMSQVVCMAYKRGPKLFKDSKEQPTLSHCLKGVCVFLYTGLVLCPINTALRRENCIFMWSVEQQSNKEVLGLWWVGLINLCVLCSEKTEQKTKKRL